MISYWKAIYQVKKILERSQVTDESRHDPEFILDKLLQYRALVIAKKYKETMVINPSWLSNLGLIETTRVLSSDVPDAISTGSTYYSKVQLPEVVNLGNDAGLSYIYTASQNKKLYPLPDLNRLNSMMKVNDMRLGIYTFIIPIGNNMAYIYPLTDRIQGRAVLANPLFGIRINTLLVKSGFIEAGVSYEVKDAEISYNGVIYVPNGTFVGIAGISTYTGNGKVYFDESHRTTVFDDPMPISMELYPEIILNILTKEYNIEAQKIPDMINDSKPESFITG